MDDFLFVRLLVDFYLTLFGIVKGMGLVDFPLLRFEMHHACTLA